MDNRKKTLSLVVTLVIYLLLDYWNLLSKIGLNINRINLDVLNIVIIKVLDTLMEAFYSIENMT